MKDITVGLTVDETQYLVNAIDTHIKTHGLGVAPIGVVIVSKLQAASQTKSQSSSKSTEDDNNLPKPKVEEKEEG